MVVKNKERTMFEKGQSGNPKGRPKGTKNKFSIAALQKALNKAKKDHNGVSFLDHLASQAYGDTTLAIALMKKLMPDLKAIEMISLLTNVADDTKEAEEIRKKLLKKMGYTEEEDE